MPRLLANKTLPITRYWIPWVDAGENGATKLSLSDGILPDPEEPYGKTLNPSLKQLHEISEKRCVVLLGQSGLGKTIVVRQWVEELGRRAQSDDAVIYLHGRNFSSSEDIRVATVASHRWREARVRGGDITLVLDGLDEVLQRMPVLLNTLKIHLDDEPPDRTRLLLVSRVAHWRESRAEELFAIWPKSDRGGAYELCPLCWKDVQIAAEESDLDAEAFTTAVRERRVSWMAGRPKLLLMLIEEFTKHQTLPSSRRELFARAALRMCEEHDPERQEILESCNRTVVSAKQMYPFVGRIAAMLLLCGKSSVVADQHLSPDAGELTITELLGDNDEDHKTLLLAAFDSAHFVANGAGRLGFDHQAMTEFMAAEYLKEWTTPQLRSVLAQRIEGTDYMLPQFREISAWIAIQHRDFCAYLLRHESRFLLEADAIELDESTRRDAIAALLAQMDREEAFDSSVSDTFLQSLSHPQLARQLRPYIVDNSRNIVVRRTAIRLAGAARCRPLKPDLWKILESSQQISVRRSAISALRTMGTRADYSLFLRLLKGSLSPDIDDELKGEALEFLVPRYLPVRSILKLLTPYEENFYGTYRRVIHEFLPQQVHLDDVIPIFTAFSRGAKECIDSNVVFPIASAALKIGLRNFSDKRIRGACIHFLIRAAEDHWWPSYGTVLEETRQLLAENAIPRRKLIEHLVEQAPKNSAPFWKYNLWPLLEDFEWVLEKTESSCGRQRKVWANLTARLTWSGIPAEAQSRFIATWRSVSALRKLLPKPRRYDIIESVFRRNRAAELWKIVWGRRSERRKKRESLLPIMEEALGKLREGQSDDWPRMAKLLHDVKLESTEAQRQSRTLRSHDVTTFRGWSLLSSADQDLIKKESARFLLTENVPLRKPGALYFWDEGALRAMVLHRSRLADDAKLRAAVKAKWLPAFFQELYNSAPELDELAKMVYQLAPSLCLSSCRADLAKAHKQDDYSFHRIRRFRLCWDKAFTNMVTDLAMSMARKPRALLYACVLLEEMAPKDALKLWKNLYNQLRGGLSTEHGRMIAFLGLFAFPRDGWDSCLARLNRCRRTMQIRFFAELAKRLYYDLRNWNGRLNERQLADLYLLLNNLFPQNKLRAYSRGGTVRTRDHIGDMQQACINTLVQRGNAAACSEFRRISETVPADERIWIRWRLRDAIDQRLRTEWTHDQPTPRDMILMASAANARRVRDATELQDAILVSLDRLQAAMHVGAYPKVTAYWREPESTPQEERMISRLIAEWLETDLCGDTGLVVDREPQVGWKGQFDIKIEVPAHKPTNRPRLVVVIEIKRCIHRDLQTACGTQLSEGYLRRKGLTHGIYLVAWFALPKSKCVWPSLDAAQKEVERWAEAASKTPLRVCGKVLDCRWRELESPNSLARVKF